MKFDWDPAKARTNLAKHGVSFEEAEVDMDDKENEIAIKSGPLKGKKVTLAPRDETESLHYELEKVLDIIGHPEALITDWSNIGDFFTGDDRDALGDCMTRIGDAFAIDVTDPNERLVDLAKRAWKARKVR